MGQGKERRDPSHLPRADDRRQRRARLKTQDYGIWLDSTNCTNTITVGATGTVSALSGKAIHATGGGTANVTSYGTIIGSYDLTSDNSTSGTFPDSSVSRENIASAKVISTSPTHGAFTDEAPARWWREAPWWAIS